jgi:signal transduction histidine kinase
MRTQINNLYHKLLVVLRLSPLSLAEKCRLTFGAAVILILVLALMIPYAWMRQLTRQISLDASRAKADMLLRQHFQIKMPGESGPAPLNDGGEPMDPNKAELRWIRFTKDQKLPLLLSRQQKETVESLTADEQSVDQIRFIRKGGVLHSSYIRIFRATDGCLSCHNPQGTAGAFNRNELIGAAVIERPAAEIGRTALLNRVWIAVAVLIGGAGAIVAFYIITQRVILRPIRQLRALANNVAEGNLDIRSSINTRDEYEKLAEAFNNMLDGLQATQEKLRQANKQLDEKIIELSERNIELFKANKIKSEFLANVSHEFRTPLNSIMGFAQVLRDKPELLTDEKGRRYAENIISGGQRLLGMINDLLHLAKTEAGKIELHIEPSDIRRLCESVVESFSEMTREKKIKVTLTVDDNIPTLSTDGGKVQQILDNFMSNAVKFTDQGGAIETKAAMIDDKTVRLSVSDTGCGIAESDREKIFEKFCRAGSPLTRESTGSGLGLAICRELAELLTGSIGLESKLGEGSTFWLDLPVILTNEQNSRKNETRQLT